jgi:hypothetical protein
MRHEAKCGETLREHHNRTTAAAKVELTVESVKSEGGCKGVAVRIHDATSVKDQYFLHEFPAGPDLYEVPASGSLELACGELGEDQTGKCTASWTLRWL